MNILDADQENQLLGSQLIQGYASKFQTTLEKSVLRLKIQEQQGHQQEDTFQKLLHYAKITGVAIVLIFILALISYIFFKILDFLQFYLIIFAILLIWYFIWVYIASTGFFAGNFVPVKRYILNETNKAINLQDKFQGLKHLIEYIQKPNTDRSIIQDDMEKATAAIKFEAYLNKVKDGNEQNLNPTQNEFLIELPFLMDKLKKIEVQDKDRGKNYGTLYEFITDPAKIGDYLQNVADSKNFIRFSEEVQEQLQSEVLPQIQRTITNIVQIQEQNTQNISDIFSDFNPLITFKLFHQFLEEILGARSFQITGNDKKKIDCLYLPPFENLQQQQIQNQGALANFIKINQPPIMLMLNKNSSYFEQEAMGSLVRFYRGLGIGVVSMNIRGYGDSEGKPRIEDIEQDGEILVRYIRDNFKPRKLGINGWSLGGMFATYLAKQCDADFLFADRTFSRPCEAARFLLEQRGFVQEYAPYLGKYSQILLQNLPFQNWGKNSGKNFVEFRGKKLLAYDRNDEIIPYPASLKNAVTNNLFDKKFQTQFPTGFQSYFEFNQLTYRLESIKISKAEQKKCFKELQFINQLIEVSQKTNKQLGNGIEFQLKSLLQSIKIDELCLLDCFNYEKSLRFGIFQQLIINIVIYNSILRPDCFREAFTQFFNQIDQIQQNLGEIRGEEGLKIQLQTNSLPSLKEIILKASNANMHSETQAEDTGVLQDHNTKIISVNLGHNNYFSEQEYKIFENYLRECEFIPNNNLQNF